MCADLYGLVLFLGLDPYWVKHWWDQLLYRPYRRGNTEPLYSVIAQILWRSAKKDVIDQVRLHVALYLSAVRRCAAGVWSRIIFSPHFWLSTIQLFC